LMPSSMSSKWSPRWRPVGELQTQSPHCDVLFYDDWIHPRCFCFHQRVKTRADDAIYLAEFAVRFVSACTHSTADSRRAQAQFALRSRPDPQCPGPGPLSPATWAPGPLSPATWAPGPLSPATWAQVPSAQPLGPLSPATWSPGLAHSATSGTDLSRSAPPQAVLSATGYLRGVPT
jgi:hypothetical protein